jgi:hypothetical protein
MNFLSIPLCLLTFCLVQSLPAAPWAIEWSDLTSSDDTEPNAVLLYNSAKKLITVGTTFGRVTDPAGEARRRGRSPLRGVRDSARKSDQP